MRSSAGPRTTARVMSWPGGNTIGRTVSAKGFIGTSTRSRSVGSRIGPPLASAYAVDPVAVEAALRRLREWCARNGYEVRAEAPSELTGAEGNQEIFLHLLPA